MDKSGKEILLKRIIAEQFGFDENEVTLNKSLAADFNMDSLDCIELVMECEDVFDISIKDEEAEKIKTVQEALDLIHEKVIND